MLAATQHTQLSSAVTIVRNQLAIEKLEDYQRNSRYCSFEPPGMRTTRTRKATTKNRQRAGPRHVPSIETFTTPADSYVGETCRSLAAVRVDEQKNKKGKRKRTKLSSPCITEALAYQKGSLKYHVLREGFNVFHRSVGKV